MPRPDELQRRHVRPARDAAPDAEPASGSDSPFPSKTRRKAEMQALQDLGEALVLLDPKRLDDLATEVDLPERLVDALREARAITAWGGRKRQMQFIGKLMRDVDPAPIRRRLELWSQGHAMEAAQQHAIERWRERLLMEPDALDALAAAYPALDRARLRALTTRARDERDRGAPPHAYRELFRELKALAGNHR
jgi:ribosome-associated protein